MRYLALLLFCLATSLAGLVQAQEPPGRVARLAYAQGSVSVYQDPELGWDKAYVNTPITSENSVWTDRGSRAELRVGGSAIRMDETTQLDVSLLDEEDFDASIERGAAHMRVRYKQPNDRITLSTPHARFTIRSDGRYRIDVDPERDESRLTVFAGEARMESRGGAIRVSSGTTVRVFGGPSSSYVTERATFDSFDRWADARDREWSDSRARQYVSSNMTGYEDLDRYGVWAQEPDYGALWYPTRVASDWAPYRTGHWAHVRPWGWTWVDDAPWGYAPFHYGRWVFVRDRWAWSPGQRVDRPAWAPALVGWVGGSNWNISVGSGASAPVVGWYPLAPWERYEPSYRSNRAYTDRLNIAVRDREPRQWQGQGDDWRRFNRDRGATVVQRDVFVDRRPVQSARVQVGVDALRQQQVVTAAQVQQILPQGNEMIRRRVDRNAAPVAAPPAQMQVQQAQPSQPVQQGQPWQGRVQQAPAQGNDQGARPNFARRGAPAPMPAPAPANQPPVQQQVAPAVNPFNPLAPPAANPASRGPAPQQNQQQQNLQQQQLQQQQQQQQAQQQERARIEAQQQQQLQQQGAQATQRAAQEAAQRAAQEAQQQQQLQQQRQAQERAARDAQQQQQQAGQAAQRAAQEAAQRAAQEAQQQQQAAQAAQRAAQEAAQRAAQEAQRAARGAPPPAPPPPAQAGAIAPQPPPQANPAARGNRDQQQRDKEEKDKKDKEEKDKQR